ncbi:lens fiber membrane intrinsic protein-like [Littorina saxatilis]|uniref:lens fiber membrane intrinsic protein-like n=1 Tax=Littorina saxatilis TaxID=31220 RepID=UPI0038B4A396
MGFKMPPIPALVGIVCAGVGLIFLIVGVATPGWTVISDLSYTAGLWSICIDDTCYNDYVFHTFGDYLYVCRVFGILGVLVLAGCVVVGVLMCFMKMDKLPIIAAILAFVAAFFILVEFAVYAGEDEDNQYGYSFALTIVAWLLAIAAGICFIVDKANTGTSVA